MASVGCCLTMTVPRRSRPRSSGYAISANAFDCTQEHAKQEPAGALTIVETGSRICSSKSPKQGRLRCSSETHGWSGPRRMRCGRSTRSQSAMSTALSCVPGSLPACSTQVARQWSCFQSFRYRSCELSSSTQWGRRSPWGWRQRAATAPSCAKAPTKERSCWRCAVVCRAGRVLSSKSSCTAIGAPPRGCTAARYVEQWRR